MMLHDVEIQQEEKKAGAKKKAKQSEPRTEERVFGEIVSWDFPFAFPFSSFFFASSSIMMLFNISKLVDNPR
jgi:hypothetical protein